MTASPRGFLHFSAGWCHAAFRPAYHQVTKGLTDLPQMCYLSRLIVLKQTHLSTEMEKYLYIRVWTLLTKTASFSAIDPKLGYGLNWEHRKNILVLIVKILFVDQCTFVLVSGGKNNSDFQIDWGLSLYQKYYSYMFDTGFLLRIIILQFSW